MQTSTRRLPATEMVSRPALCDALPGTKLHCWWLVAHVSSFTGAATWSAHNASPDCPSKVPPTLCLPGRSSLFLILFLLLPFTLLSLLFLPRSLMSYTDSHIISRLLYMPSACCSGTGTYSARLHMPLPPVDLPPPASSRIYIGLGPHRHFKNRKMYTVPCLLPAHTARVTHSRRNGSCSYVLSPS